MRKSVLIASLITICTMGIAHAELTVQDVTSKEYLKNQGYSSATINAIQHSKSVANGEEYTQPAKNEYSNNPAIKFVRRIFTYLDPALDDNTFYNKHDIQTSPSFDDL